MQNQEAATIASGSQSHATFSIIKKLFLLSQQASETGVWLWNHATFAIIHTDKIYAQYPIYINSDLRSCVITSDVEPESNVDHQMQRNWRNLYFHFLLSTGKSHWKKIGIDSLSPTSITASNFIFTSPRSF